MKREELPELVKNYTPAKNVLQHISNLNLLMMIGPSGVGKTTLIKKSALPFVPSDTTRQPRFDEQNGVDFFFRADYKDVVGDIKAGRFVQVAIGPGGDFYATRDTSYPKAGIATMPVVADVVPIFRQLGFANTISVFITPPSFEEWMRRMNTRKVDQEQLAKRLDEAKRSFEFALSDKEIHFILNDKVNAAVHQIIQLIAGKIDVQGEQKARTVAASLLSQLH